MRPGSAAASIAVLLAVACSEAPPLAVQTGGDRRYTAEIAAPSVPSGRDAILRARVRPAEGWHLAVEFPVALDVWSASGVTVPEPMQTRDMASELGEDEVAFEVPYTRVADADAFIAGAIRFGICRGDLCERVEHEFDLALATP